MFNRITDTLIIKTMISKAPSHLKSKEDHKTVRALYLETPEVMVSSMFIKPLVTLTYAIVDEVSPGRKLMRFGCYFHTKHETNLTVRKFERLAVQKLEP